MDLTRRRLIAIGAAAAAGGTAALYAPHWLGTPGGLPFAMRATRLAPDEPEQDAEGRLRFVVTGDSGAATETRTRTSVALEKLVTDFSPEFLVLTGDNVYPHGVTSAEDPAWKIHVEDIFGPTKLPIYPCLGNHDHEGTPEAQLDYSKTNPQWRLPSAYHSFRYDIGPKHSAEFFVLDSQALRTSFPTPWQSKQMSWLERALAGSNATWKLLVGHHPLKSGGPKGASDKLVRSLGAVLERHPVDFYLSGHNHTLELADSGLGCVQLVSGAFAAPDTVKALPESLYSYSGGGIVSMALGAEDALLTFIDEHSATLERFRIERA